MLDITIEQALQKGITTRHTDMENGELRYRLLGSDGSSYIRTEADRDCWENGHYHKKCREMYIVQCGYMFFCELKDGIMLVRKMMPGEYFLTEPYVAHTVFMKSGAVTHTVKFGQCEEGDWYASSELDKLTHGLAIEDLEKMCMKG